MKRVAPLDEATHDRVRAASVDELLRQEAQELGAPGARGDDRAWEWAGGFRRGRGRAGAARPPLNEGRPQSCACRLGRKVGATGAGAVQGAVREDGDRAQVVGQGSPALRESSGSSSRRECRSTSAAP